MVLTERSRRAERRAKGELLVGFERRTMSSIAIAILISACIIEKTLSPPQSTISSTLAKTPAGRSHPFRSHVVPTVPDTKKLFLLGHHAGILESSMLHTHSAINFRLCNNTNKQVPK